MSRRCVSSKKCFYVRTKAPHNLYVCFRNVEIDSSCINDIKLFLNDKLFVLVVCSVIFQIFYVLL